MDNTIQTFTKIIHTFWTVILNIHQVLSNNSLRCVPTIALKLIFYLVKVSSLLDFLLYWSELPVGWEGTVQDNKSSSDRSLRRMLEYFVCWIGAASCRDPKDCNDLFSSNISFLLFSIFPCAVVFSFSREMQNIDPITFHVNPTILATG